LRELNTQADRYIHARADRIWAYRLDFLHLPEYNSDVRGIERVAGGSPTAPGATYRFDLVTGSHTSPVELQVTGAIPGELVTIEMDGLLRAHETFSLSPAPAEGGDGDGDRSLVAIALTLFVPDHFPPANDAAMLANGETQIAGELDRMREILERPAADPSRDEDNHG
jgi:hypothetical protein